jgi:glycerol-3-phosphate O-acyltransferase/dihydroxyacetone phosphate acyltransferase
MATRVKILSLGDMIRNRRGTFVYRFVVFIFSAALKLFFRRIETANAEIVPSDDAVIFVMNHPNGLIDPALVFVALPRKISFLAKSTLFKMPVISSLLKTVEALPLYRKIDAGEDVSKNQHTFALVREMLKKGGAIAIFPEGVSHNSPKLLPLKTGAARIALGTVSVGRNPASLALKIVPVGMFYTSKTTFRSEALLHFGEPFSVLPTELDEDGEPPRTAVKELNEKILAALKEVTLNAETEIEMENANLAGELFSSVYEGINFEQTLADKFDFLRRYASDRAAKKQASETDEELKRRIREYEKKLGEFDIEPETLSLTNHSFWFVFRYFLARLYLILIFLPVSIIGAVLHFPAYQLCRILAFYFTHHGEDDIVSTVKILASMLFMPLTWLILSIVLYFVWDWRIALFSIPLAAISGYAAMRTLEELEDLRGWFRAVRLFYLKRKTFLQLLTERRALHEALRVNSEK